MIPGAAGAPAGCAPAGAEPLTGAKAGSATVVLLHGVGVGAASFTRVIQALGPGHRVIAPDRAGYGDASAPPRATMARQVADLRAFLATVPTPPDLVAGVSGGATVVLAAALDGLFTGGGAPALLLHEPLLGELAPALHALAASAAARLSAEGTPAVDAFLEALAGRALPPVDAATAATVRAEAPGFLAFQPTRPGLERLRALPLVIATVGRHSPPPRHMAAELLAHTAGARLVRLPQGSHLAQLDAPDALAAAIAAAVREAAAMRGAAADGVHQ